MNRRAFVTGLGAVLATPLAAEAQRARQLSRVGVLTAGLPDDPPEVAFFDRMRELGYAEGQSVIFVRRFAAGKIEHLPTLATQIVAANPDVIFAPVTPAALAARKLTNTIPIVFAVSADPVDAGLVKSLPQPGSNITGITSMNRELAAKRLELLREAAPRISRVAVFSNPDNVPDRQQLDALRNVGARVGVAIVPIAVRTANDYRIAFESAEAQSADAIHDRSQPTQYPFSEQGRRVCGSTPSAHDGCRGKRSARWHGDVVRAELGFKLSPGCRPRG